MAALRFPYMLLALMLVIHIPSETKSTTTDKKSEGITELTPLKWYSTVDGPHEAILIANGKYQNAPKLDNTANDARLLEVGLKAKGFQVTTLIDLDFASMSLNLEAFAKSARNSAGVNIVYFAGHGVQLEGSNYLLPTDADMSSEIALKNSAVDLGALLKSSIRSRRERSGAWLSFCSMPVATTPGVPLSVLASVFLHLSHMLP